MGRDSQHDHELPERTLRRRCQIMWDLIPPVPCDGIVHPILHLDGIHLGRQAVVLIAMDEHSYVVGWYVARQETSYAWKQLLYRLTPPDLVVCDGGGGLLKALREYWPDTPIQRCLFHVLLNVNKLLGLHPRYQAAQRLKALAVQLAQVHDEDSSRTWLVDYHTWRTNTQDFLSEQSQHLDGKEHDLHERLVRARRLIDNRIKEGHLFTFLEFEGAPTTNNRIESSNARIRQILRDHRGLSLFKRIRAIQWWCHEHTEHPHSDAWLAAHAVTNQQLEAWYEHARNHTPQALHNQYGLPEQYGTGINWNEFHTSTPWNN